MDIRPIRTDDDHAAALAEIEHLWGAAPNSPEGDKLDVLATLVEAYEEKRWPITSPDPVDVIEFAISEMGHSQAELGHLIGKSRASEILSRKRPLTLHMVQALHEGWRIPAELLVKPYHLDSGEKTKRKGRKHIPVQGSARESKASSRIKSASGERGDPR